MQHRRRGTRSAVKGQLTIVAVVLMAVVFLILAGVSETLGTTTGQNQQTLQTTNAQNLAQTAAAWLTNNLNTQPNYILGGTGPFAQDGTYSPPGGVANATHQFVSEWMQFNAAGHYQACSSTLLQPCVRFDPATAYFSTSYNPASTANMATSLQEENVAATIEVEQNCLGVASACKDSFYSTTIGRRGFYNYLAFTNYATLDPAQYSPLGLTNPGSICQTNNAASGCVPVSYQSNGTPSPNGMFGGGSDTAPVFNGANEQLVYTGTGSAATAPVFNSANQLTYTGNGSPTPEDIYYSAPISVTPGDTYTFSANMDATNVPIGNTIMTALWNGTSINTTSTILFQNGGTKGVVSGQVTIPAGVTQEMAAYQIDGPTVPSGANVTWSGVTLTQSGSSTPIPIAPVANWTNWNGGMSFAAGNGQFQYTNDYVSANVTSMQTATSNVTLESYADVPTSGGDGFINFVGTGLTGYGMAIANGPCWSSCTPGFQVVGLYQMVRWISTGATVTPGWHQFVLSINSSGQPSFYVDGQLVYSDTGSAPNSPNGPVIAGSDRTGLSGGRNFSGPLAQVSVYNQALTASQVLDQYNAASASTYDAVTAADSPLAWWKLSEPVGATSAQDSSGNGYTGTYSNPVSAVVPGPLTSATPEYIYYSQPVTVIPGDTYTFSANMDATNVPTGNTIMTALWNGASINTTSTILRQAGGTKGVVSGQVIIPAGVTQEMAAYQIDGPTIPAGAKVTWSQIQLTQSGSTTPMQFSPLSTWQNWNGGMSFGPSNGQFQLLADYVSANPGSVLTATSNVTLEGWANVPATGGDGFITFLGTNLTGYGVAVASGPCGSGPTGYGCAPGFEVVGLYQMVRWIPTGVTVTPGWHQFVLSLNSSGQPSIYVDGQLIYSDTGAGPNVPNGSALIDTDTNVGRAYSGPIADVLIYNKTLSASQILDQYNAAAAGTYDAVTAADSPLAWWKLSEPVGATSAQDSSGNGYTGTYSNPVSAVVPGPMAASVPQQIQSAGLVTGDSLYGALRTNSPTVFVCDGNTLAFDVPLIQATSAKVMTATQPGCGLPSSATTTTQQVSPMAMPTNVGSLDQAAFPYIFPDGTSFDFTPSGINVTFTGSSSYMTNNWPALEAALAADNTVMLVSGSSVTIENMAIPPSGVLYVDGSVSNVVGVVNGQVTIAADGNINVDNQPDPTVGNNLYYYCGGQGAVNPNVIAPGCTDLLGLDAQGSVAIGPQQYVQTAWGFYGTGLAAGWQSAYPQPVTVAPGDTYTFTTTINATNVLAGSAAPMIQIYIPAIGQYTNQTFYSPGSNETQSTTFTDPAGVTTIYPFIDMNNAATSAGQLLTWSNITFTQQGSAANLLGPPSQWTNTNTIGTSNGDWNVVPAELAPMVVDSAITALGNVPGVPNSNGSIYGAQWQTPTPNKQNPSCLVDAPDLTINGAMISQYQGTFGQYLGLYPSNPCLLSGYRKHFFWDIRLAYEQPPFALSPGSTNFVETGLVEVSRP